MARAKTSAVDTAQTDDGLHKIIQEIIALERLYYFEKKNVTSERQRKVKEIIERHTSGGEE